MKNYLFLSALIFAAFSIGFIHSCKKDSVVPSPSDIGITKSFTEEFENVPVLVTSGGWVKKNNTPDSMSSPYIDWGQGQVGVDKGGYPYGFPAYSYSSSKDEYAYSAGGVLASISSWLITPVLSVKNGDKISFYTRGDTAGVYTDRMQVLMNNSTSADVGYSLKSVGSFTTVLFDIDPKQAQGGYPSTWTKYEYTFSGISGKMDTRIAFRHYAVNPLYFVEGIGIDLFQFQVN